MIRVMVVDDHPIVRAGIVGLLETEPDFDVVGEAVSGEEALTIAADVLPDVVLMDLRLKSRMAGGFCLRAPAQGACTYANICEHCPSYRSEPSSLPILAAQRVDAAALVQDAEQRGWIDEAARHHKLIARLDALITDTEAQAG